MTQSTYTCKKLFSILNLSLFGGSLIYVLKSLCDDRNHARRKSIVVEAIRLKVGPCNECSAESKKLFV